MQLRIINFVFLAFSQNSCSYGPCSDSNQIFSNPEPLHRTVPIPSSAALFVGVLICFSQTQCLLRKNRMEKLSAKFRDALMLSKAAVARTRDGLGIDMITAEILETQGRHMQSILRSPEVTPPLSCFDAPSPSRGTIFRGMTATLLRAGATKEIVRTSRRTKMRTTMRRPSTSRTTRMARRGYTSEYACRKG
jgi:hypothetical protein